MCYGGVDWLVVYECFGWYCCQGGGVVCVDICDLVYVLNVGYVGGVVDDGFVDCDIVYYYGVVDVCYVCWVGCIYGVICFVWCQWELCYIW